MPSVTLFQTTCQTTCQTTNAQQLLEIIATELQQIPTPMGRAQLMAGCDVLAGLRFEKDLIHAIFREEVMQESVTYQDIFQKGVTQGIQQGVQQGEVTVVLQLLQGRFGEVAPEFRKSQGLVSNWRPWLMRCWIFLILPPSRPSWGRGFLFTSWGKIS